METAKIILEYIKVLIYPGVLIFALLLFKKQIQKLFEGNIKAKYKDVEISIEAVTREIDSIRKSNKHIVNRLQEMIEDAGPERIDGSPLFSTIDSYVKTLNVVQGYWENMIIDFLRSSDRKASKSEIIKALISNSTPQRRHRDEAEIKQALQNLLQTRAMDEQEGVCRLFDMK